MWDIVKPSRRHPWDRGDDRNGAFWELLDGVAHA
jgi:hypothetical protein